MLTLEELNKEAKVKLNKIKFYFIKNSVFRFFK
jgi:hypothetical protein